MRKTLAGIARGEQATHASLGILATLDTVVAVKLAAELFAERRPAYALADLIVETGDRLPEELAAEILKLLA